ncbi:nuclear transport factor 2 family protein [Longimicrobium terrae]|uniref:DUF4440 domain-containing protein n=1 Tax=Longimicrobium terrae TaxID=1639882 RepID=A0A841GWU2_9BACT|nr:nuclear transport factor 2 family protein [Longimicrobium terrae]MBB4635391.1 hypothetical protein [Longimicrobium terrae]MBB6069785.1 hypothetical protein [Longimicrobium terrae]NNC31006.1 nuclear transport factor 2 family protein [Longimicrobium terrae]
MIFDFVPAPRVLAAAALLLAAGPGALSAQSAPAPAPTSPADPSTYGPLYDEIARMDSILFDAAFYSCDAAKVNAIFSDDVEFYHDLGGAQEVDAVRESSVRMARGCADGSNALRVLVPGSMHVYPMNNYGAVQVADHRFVQRDGSPTGIAKMVMLWRRTDAGWRVTRVISYDHHEDHSAPARDD